MNFHACESDEKGIKMKALKLWYRTNYKSIWQTVGYKLRGSPFKSRLEPACVDLLNLRVNSDFQLGQDTIFAM